MTDFRALLEFRLSDPQRRSRGVVVFGQFGGAACHDSVGDREFCLTDAPCNQPPPPVCSVSEFRCESGKVAAIKIASERHRATLVPELLQMKLYAGNCIKKRLACNGDYDCEDGSDEDCESVRKPCLQSDLNTNEQARTAGYG